MALVVESTLKLESTMNKATLQIAEFIAIHYGPCDLATASRVQSRMADNGASFSNCTQSQFEQAIREAYCACEWEDGDNKDCPVHRAVAKS
jgi:hypothetical protein